MINYRTLCYKTSLKEPTNISPSSKQNQTKHHRHLGAFINTKTKAQVYYFGSSTNANPKSGIKLQ